MCIRDRCLALPADQLGELSFPPEEVPPLPEGCLFVWWAAGKPRELARLAQQLSLIHIWATHYVDGLTSPADYPDHFHKGVICHSNTITCKGTWKVWCNKEWYGTYAIERRYPEAVSYTHLDVYKRQAGRRARQADVGSIHQ